MTRRVLGLWIGAAFVATLSCSSTPAGPAGADQGNPMGDDAGNTSSGVSSGTNGSSGSGSPGADASGSSGASGSGSSGAGSSSGTNGSSGTSLVDGGGSSGAAHDAGGDAAVRVDAGGGGSSSSGSAACTWPGALNYSGNASFTCYYFGQGTTMSGGGYKTACGYGGRETTGGSGNNCGQAASDTVDNIANSGLAKSTYFAAIPGDASGGFGNVSHCGECEELTNPGNGHSVIVTIIDECPINGNQNTPCKNAGHLDVSMQAFNALGFSTGNPSGTTWKAVPCPVTGTIQAVLNAGMGAQVYFQNTVYSVKSVAGATQSPYGYWQFSGGGAGGPVTLTDVEGHIVTATIPGGGGDLKVQFPSPGTCN